MPAPRKLFRQLRHRIEDTGCTYQEIAESLGRTRGWLSNKFTGRSPWTVAEAIEISARLGIPPEEIADYFKDATLVREKHVA